MVSDLTTMTTMKAFFAINLPETTKLALDTLCQEWQKKITFPIKWQRREKFHITLRFLGKIPVAMVSTMIPLIAAQLKEVASFDLTFTQTELFPNLVSPNVLSLRMGPTLPLIELNKLLETVIRAVGIPADPRPFMPHLTLAHLKLATEFPTGLLDNPMTFHVNHIVLFHSERLPTHSIYHEIVKIPLAAIAR